jgi:3-isopropylmalate/(R)-2-methylmalate dehydratase large subunit
MGQTLYEKVFDRHVVREITPGQYQLLASLHLLNEVSSPQAFEAGGNAVSRCGIPG